MIKQASAPAAKSRLCGCALLALGYEALAMLSMRSTATMTDRAFQQTASDIRND